MVSALLVLLVTVLLFELTSMELKLVKLAKSDRLMEEERRVNQNKFTVSEDEKRKEITELEDKTTQLIPTELYITAKYD